MTMKICVIMCILGAAVIDTSEALSLQARRELGGAGLTGPGLTARFDSICERMKEGTWESKYFWENNKDIKEFPVLAEIAGMDYSECKKEGKEQGEAKEKIDKTENGKDDGVKDNEEKEDEVKNDEQNLEPGLIGVELEEELLDLICDEELTSAAFLQPGLEGFTQAFYYNLAHRLHSITIEDIARYFGVAVEDRNGIPTVNKDLSSEQRVLEDAPKGEFEQRFITDALKNMDMVLRKIDDESFVISALEKLAHHLHMAEMWARAGTHYAALLLRPPSEHTCDCVRYSSEAVRQALHVVDIQIKYPGVTSAQFDKLDSREGWAYWKERMIGMQEDGNVDFAVYMYCKLQK